MDLIITVIRILLKAIKTYLQMYDKYCWCWKKYWWWLGSWQVWIDRRNFVRYYCFFLNILSNWLIYFYSRYL
jgi:hypothetical protein